MSRLTEALRRARSLGADSSVPGDRGAAIRFFAPGQPAVAIPWRFDGAEERCEELSPDRLAPESSASLAMTRTAAVKWHANPRLVVSPDVELEVKDQCRRLAALLQQAQYEHHVSVVMVTSAQEGEGKSLTVTNLALTLSEAYRRQVLLVDADLQRPSVHALLDLPNTAGLSEVLKRPGPLPLVQVSPHLTLLTAGTAYDDPTPALVSDRLRTVIDEVRSRFEWVLIDTAPIAQLTGMPAVGEITLLVVRAGRTSLAAARQAVDSIGDRLFGVVLNGARGTVLTEPYPASRSKSGAASS